MATSKRDLGILNLIQRTPHVEYLSKLLKKKGFPTIDEAESETHTRFEKCRRLYDTLMYSCFDYSYEQSNDLKKVLHDSGNANAGELLYSLGGTTTGIFDDADVVTTFSPGSRGRLTKQESTSTKSFMEMFLVIKNGNSTQLEKMLQNVALDCGGITESFRATGRYSRLNFRRSLKDSGGIEKFRERLGSILLTRRDYMDKTLLHVAANSNSIECINTVLKYATEAHKKFEMLDAQESFGQTALHLAIRRKDLQMTKKLIFEGSNLFIRNQAGQNPLMMLFQRLPAAASFLFDTTVTISGDIFSDQFYFNIDLSVLTADILILDSYRSTPGASRSFHMKPQSIPINIPEDLNTPTPNKESLPLLPFPFPKGNQHLKLSHELRILHATIVTTLLTLGQYRLSEDILAHPVVQTFLDLKWKKLRILLFTTYTGLRLSVYGLYMLLTYFIYFTTCPFVPEKKKCGPLPLWAIGLFPTLIFIFGFTLNSLVKLSDLRKLRNLKKRFIWGPAAGHFLVNFVFLVVATWTSIAPTFSHRALKDYEYALATGGILMSSGLILQVFGNSNWNWTLHSIYVRVYGKVMLRFISVLATFSPLIVAFTLAFNVMYPQVKEFSSFWRSFFRLVIMLQGEFEYEDKIYQNFQNSTLQIGENSVQFWSGQILFSVLGCVLTLVLIDVFLGYTVSDINELKKQAEFHRRCNQVEQMAETEVFNEFVASVAKLLCCWNIAPYMDTFNVINADRKHSKRSDVIISYEEISDNRLQQFRKILVERN